MTSSAERQEPTSESTSAPIPGDTPEENYGHVHGALSVNMQEVMRLAELVGSATGDMKALIDTVEGCLSEARALAESNGITLDDDVGIALKEIAVSVRSVAKQVGHIAGAAVVELSQSLAIMGVDLQKAVARMAVAQADSGWHAPDPPM